MIKSNPSKKIIKKKTPKNKSPGIFYKELTNFLKSKKRIIFAYSGGLDSTMALHYLNKECKHRKIRLIVFTIDHGFKGKKILENIQKVISFEELNNSHYIINISQMQITKTKKVFDYYFDFFKKSKLPCGPNCNKVLQGVYKIILNDFNEKELFTGGDTTSLNSKGKQSIFRDKNGYTEIRTAAAFGLTRNKSKKLIKQLKIPWSHPKCGGYDTDCLIPGATLKTIMDKGASVDEIHSKFPIIEEFLKSRLELKIINKKEYNSLKKKIDLPNSTAYSEFKEITSNKKQK